MAGVGNWYTAQFWEYGTRLGRRWNLDPKPNYSVSLYSVFRSNPILFSDRLGDTLTVGRTAQAKTDIKSLLGRHSDAVNFDAKNQVHINDAKLRNQFKERDGTFDELAYNNYVATDNGYSTLTAMINDVANYYYGTDKTFSAMIQPAGGAEYTVGRVDRRSMAGQTVEDYRWFTNLSVTPYGNDPATHAQYRPAGKYKGAVYIQEGTVYGFSSTGSIIRLPRSSFVFHELTENYLRTHRGLSYDDAHQRAAEFEGDKFGNGHPGYFRQFKYR